MIDQTTATPDYFARVALFGQRTALLPVSREHADGLAAAGADPAIWRWLPAAYDRPGAMAAFVDSALALQIATKAVAFTTVDTLTGRIAGSTRFLAIEPEQRRLEIGFTWLGRDFQRSHVNTEAKLLQMWYAFEVLGCRRVEWKTDANNGKARPALQRIGATKEGVFRQHMIYPDGRNRDSVYFAVVDGEWPSVRDRLVLKLGFPFDPKLRFETASIGGSGA